MADDRSAARGGARENAGLANEGVRFVLELCLVGIAGWWGWSIGTSTGESVVIALLLPFAVIGVWGALAAPRRPYRTPSWFPSVLFLVLTVLAVGALVGLGHITLAVLFGTIAVLNELLLRVGVRTMNRADPPR